MLGAVPSPDTPDSDAAVADAPVSLPRNATHGKPTREMLLKLEQERLVEQRTQLLEDRPSVGGAIALTSVGGLLSAGSAAMWIMLGATGTLGRLGVCGGHGGCLFGVISVMGLVIAGAVGIEPVMRFALREGGRTIGAGVVKSVKEQWRRRLGLQRRRGYFRLA